MAESEEEPKNILMSVNKESEKCCLKLSIHETNTVASSPITLWQTDGETVKEVIDFITWISK